MSTQLSLPHDPYIAAVLAALALADLEPDDYWTSDAEIDPYRTDGDAGVATMLDAVLGWTDPTDDETGGLFLFWEHPAEQWQYARPRREGGNTALEFLPHLGRYAHPDTVVATARALLDGTPRPEGHAPYWPEADAVKAAITAWEAAETSAAAVS